MSSAISSSPLRLALIDLSGTLHVGDEPIDGAVDAIHKLLSYQQQQQQQQDSSEETSSFHVLFLTNTTTVSARTLHHKLTHQMGFSNSLIRQSDIMTSAHAVRNYMKQKDLHRPYCLVERDMLEQDLAEFSSRSIGTHREFDSVLVGLSPSSFHYETLNDAFRILRKYPAGSDRLVAFHRSKYVRDADHQLSIGPGGFVACLEHATGHTAHIVGKPSVEFFRAAVEYKLEHEMKNCFPRKVVYDSVIMVGDDYINDIQGAQSALISHTVLVQTGKYQTGDEDNLSMAPTRVVPSIVEAVEYILGQLVEKEVR